MYWSKVKTIFIVIFLLFNAFLLLSLSFIGQTGNTAKKNVVTLLEKNNITIDKSVLSMEQVSMPVYQATTLTSDRDQLINNFLGYGFKETEPQKFINGKKQLEFFDIEECKSFEFTNKESEIQHGEDIESLTLNLLKKYNLHNEQYYINSYVFANNKYVIQLSQKLKDFSIFGSNLEMIIDIGKEEVIKGDLASNISQVSTSQKILPVYSILASLINEEYFDNMGTNGVTSIIGGELCYLLNYNDYEDIANIIPGYRIIVQKEGMKRDVFFDARTGEIK